MTPIERAQKIFADNFEKSLDERLRTLHAQRVYKSFNDGLQATTDLVKSFGCDLDNGANWKPIGRDESAKFELDITGLKDKKLFLSVYRGPAGEHEFYSCLRDLK